MASTNHSTTKQSLKMLEVPLNKFREEMLPYHQRVFEDYKGQIQQLIAAGDVAQLSKEIRKKKRTVRQLNELSYELDTLRTQVENADLDVFDSRTVSLRKIILNLIEGYSELEKTVNRVINDHQEQINTVNVENTDPFEGVQQIQIQENLDDLKLKEHETRLKSVKAIEEDVEGIHGIYSQLHQMVGEQAEHVENVENNVEVTEQNVKSGLKQIIKAHKLKAVTYPLTGAVVGTAVGGPIGLVAGAKVGAIAAVGLGVVGYLAGAITKKFKKDMIESNEPQGVVEVDPNIADKKDI